MAYFSHFNSVCLEWLKMIFIVFKTLLYILLTGLSLAAFSRFRNTESSFWKGVVAAIIFLGIGGFFFNDLGMRVRLAMKETGVYGERGDLQIELITGVCVFVLMSIFVFARTIPAKKSRRILIFCLSLLILATAVEVISLHATDALLNRAVFWKITVRHVLFPVLQLAVLASLAPIVLGPAEEDQDSSDPEEDRDLPPSQPDDDSFRAF